MRYRDHLRELGHVLALAAILFLPLPAPAAAVEKTRFADFDAEMKFLHDYLDLAGLAVGIVEAGEIRWFRGYGHADLARQTPVTRHTPFHLASLTKPVAATMLMQLVEQDRLDLDQPARDFGIDLPAGGEISIRHILTHTSHGQPGHRYRYDGSRFATLDHVIKKLTGRRFEEQLAQAIIRPLGLSQTGPMSMRLAPPLARPYRRDETGQLDPAKYPEYFGSSAGLVSSVADYARFLTALQQDQLMKPATRARSFTAAQSPSGEVLPYGLGWFVETVRGEKIVWHYGYWTAVSSLVVLVPDRDIAVIALANTDGLSRGFRLGRGQIANSPVGNAFLNMVVFGE